MKFRTLFLAALCFTMTFVLTGPVSAQINRTAVSINGSDLNACSVLSPCRSFDRAILQTNPGGEVIALDSGGYGPFTIDKAVSVQAAPGVYAGITVPTGSTGVDVIAGPSDEVEIRGLTILGLNTATISYGIHYQSGRALHVHDAVIGKFYGHGIFGDLAANGSLYVSNTLVRGTDIGIFFKTTSGIIKGSVDNTRVENVGNAAYSVSDNARVTVSNSVASGSSMGFRIIPVLGTISELNIESCVSSNNSIGLLANASSGTSTMRVSNTMVTNNGTGILIQNGGTHNVITWGNNRMAGNTTPGAFTGTLAQQ